MNILFLMIPMALMLGFVFVLGFIWAVNNEQMDDLETPAVRILNDENRHKFFKNKSKTNTTEREFNDN